MGLTGQGEKGNGGHRKRCRRHPPVQTRVDEPQRERAEQTKVSKPLGGECLDERDRVCHAERSKPTMSSVVSATATPAALNASSLLFAVPRLPEMIAPA